MSVEKYFGHVELIADQLSKNFKQRRLSFLDKVRNMSDDEFSKFKEDFQNGNFRKHWKQHTPESNS